jgi:hypothetical protein
MKTHYIFLSLIFLATSYGLAAEDVVLKAEKEGCTAFHDAVMKTGLYEHAKKEIGEKHSMAPFTVFVPTNDACSVLKDLPQDQQKKLLPFHVVPGKQIENPAEEMKTGVSTVGEQLLFMKDSKLFLDESETHATIIKGPIAAKNGVIYIIDHILAPAGTTLPTTHTESPASAPTTQLTQPTTAHTHSNEDEEEGEAPQHGATSTPVATPTQTTLTMQPMGAAPLPAAPTNLLTEQTGQVLASGITQLTQSIQLLIHVIQQAQQQVGTQTPSESVPLTVIP